MAEREHLADVKMMLRAYQLLTGSGRCPAPLGRTEASERPAPALNGARALIDR